MIEEEDDEDILKKGVTFKSVLKNLFSILLVILGALFIYFELGPDQFSSFMIGFVLFCSGATLLQVQKPTPEPTRQTLTIIKCKSCEITKVRNYEKGDFIFKRKDVCEKCDGSMEIQQIYSVKLKKPTEENKTPETKKESIKLTQ